MYDALFRATDDDAGTGTDTVKVLITGDPSNSRGAGYWQHQYRGNGKIDFTDCTVELLPRDLRVPERCVQRGA